MIFILLFPTFLRMSYSANTTVESTFYKHAICNVQERIAKGCSQEIPHARSVSDCLAMCSRQKLCLGASMDDTGKRCFHHEDCLIASPCDTSDKHDYWYKHCLHGEWDSDTLSCTCKHLSSGTRCEKCWKSCTALLESRINTNLYWICLDPDQDGLNTFIVLCYVDPPSISLLLLAKNEGNVIFNRTWEEYANGFNQSARDIWLGLEVWHALTTFYGYSDLKIHMDIAAGAVSCIVYNFIVQSEEESYRYYHNGHNCSAVTHKNCLKDLKGVPFSTWDTDADNDTSQNCASKSGSGWWYSGCDPPPCRLLGGGFKGDWSEVPKDAQFRWSELSSSKLKSLSITRLRLYL